MKSYHTLALLAALSFGTCKKDQGTIPHSLAGKWRMAEVTDLLTNTSTQKPLSVKGDVDIRFSFANPTAGGLDGVTPTNDLQADFSTTTNNDLGISNLAYSKVMETSWGALFLDNIRSSHDYSIDAFHRLNINTSNSKRLIFIPQ